MTVFDQHVRHFWAEGGWYLIAVVPVGWLAVAIALRSGFARRPIAVKLACAGALAAVVAGLVCEQLELRAARELALQSGLRAIPADLERAMHLGAVAPRMLGAAIAVFALLVVGLGAVRRRFGETPPAPPTYALWRLLTSAALLFVAATIVIPNLVTLSVAFLSHRSEGVVPGSITAALAIVLGCAIGMLGTYIRDGGKQSVGVPAADPAI